MHLPTSYEAGQLGGGRAGSGRPVRGGQRTTGPGRRDPTPGARQAPDAQLGSANSARRSGGDARPARPAWVSLRATAGPAPSLKGPPRLHEAAEPRCPSDPGRMETWSWPHLTWVFLARSSPRGLHLPYNTEIINLALVFHCRCKQTTPNLLDGLKRFEFTTSRFCKLGVQQGGSFCRHQGRIYSLAFSSF